MFDPFSCAKNVPLLRQLIWLKFTLSIDCSDDWQFCIFFLTLLFNLMFPINSCCRCFYLIVHFIKVVVDILICFKFKYFSFDIKKLSFLLTLSITKFEDIYCLLRQPFYHNFICLSERLKYLSLNFQWLNFLSLFFIRSWIFIYLFEIISSYIV